MKAEFNDKLNQQLEKKKSESGERLKEILAILHKHELTHGLTPEKLVAILTDLGPTYVKFGQILSMRPDFLPQKYCDALKALTSDVEPMPVDLVKAHIEEDLGQPVHQIFKSFDDTPLGSASIGQVHAAVLHDGTEVVVKVQRPGIHEMMAMDIVLLRKAVSLIDIFRREGDEVVDLDMLLEEMWVSAQQEMDYQNEAKNAMEFYSLNEDVAFATCPKIYPHYTTSHILTMEKITGIPVYDTKRLVAEGYDPTEIGTKLADNFVKQFVVDGFFHADPHQGNIMIREGKIVWLDMGMMGRLNAREQKLIEKGVQSLAENDVDGMKNVVLSLGVVKDKVNHMKLRSDISDLLSRYSNADLGNMDLSVVMQDVLNVARDNHIAMAKGLSMLARGIATIEGVVASLSPDINLVEIATSRVSGNLLDHIDWKTEGKNYARTIYASAKKSLEIPALIGDSLNMLMKGQSKVNFDINSTEEFTDLMTHLVNKLVGGLLAAALLIASSLICTTDMQPHFFHIPLLGFVGYVAAIVFGFWVFYKKRDKPRKK